MCHYVRRAELNDPVRRKIERYQLTRTIDPRHFYPTIESAIAAFRDETGAGWPPTRAQPQYGAGSVHPLRMMAPASSDAGLLVHPRIEPRAPRLPGGTFMTAETPVLDTLTDLTAASAGHNSLPARELMLARIAALIAMDAPPASYLTNAGVAKDVGITAEDIQGVMIAVAPVVGTARVVSAGGNILRALGLAIAVADAEASLLTSQADPAGGQAASN
jgi:alkylhydroperoxidase/carboxymuconolactone decarboxylase family protein YurZ